MSSIALIITIPFTFAHMSMQYPHPRDNDGAYAQWQANEPMITVHPQICHGLASDTTIPQGNTFNVGDAIQIDIYGSAPHNGGHCAFWYSTDDITFTKIIDINDCTINPTTVTLPTTMPVQCQTKCTFAFTWVPTSSGACEIYMNCADIQVNGASGGNSNPITLNFKTSFIDQSTNGYGCSRVDEKTHWTTIFARLKTTYDSSVTVANGEIIDNTDSHSQNCYASESLVINLDNDIDNSGTCGSGLDAYRCDDGKCCSPAGYCGPDYDGTGYVNYETDGYFDDINDAYSTYCTNAIGDWRVVTCDKQLNTSVNNIKEQIVALPLVILFLTIAGGMLIICYEKCYKTNIKKDTSETLDTKNNQHRQTLEKEV